MVVCATAESAIMLENHLNQNGYQVPDTFPLISFGPAFGPVSLKQKNISEMRFSPANLGKNTVNILMERLNGNRSAWKCARSNALFFERASSKILPASRLKSAPVLT
jgi:DNA-binding LacI/PurR family transcriptional regulator